MVLEGLAIRYDTPRTVKRLCKELSTYLYRDWCCAGGLWVAPKLALWLAMARDSAKDVEVSIRHTCYETDNGI